MISVSVRSLQRGSQGHEPTPNLTVVPQPIPSHHINTPLHTTRYPLEFHIPPYESPLFWT